MLERHTCRPVRPEDEADLFGRLAIDGDDGFGFMNWFDETFDIDMSAYRWYFHHGEEGYNIGGLFFAPPYRRVPRIPVTLKTLIEAAETKRWPIVYPEHELPKVRWDIRFNQLFAALAFAGLAVWLWQRFGG
jgi:hypothetical protein